jgi:hypothetical protein
MAKEDFIKVSGVWKNRDGKPWMSGKVKVALVRAALEQLGGADEVTVFVFQNDKRGNDKAPDGNVSFAAVRPRVDPAHVHEFNRSFGSDDDIPF